MKLNRFIYVVLALLTLSFLVNCRNQKSFSKKANQTEELDTIVIENDSLEYKLVILDYGFNAWLATQKPRGYHSQRYMELKNQPYVNEYNIRARNANRYDPNLYPMVIKYSPNVDYGYEVNYMLYHYFLFFQEKYNQNLR